MIKKLSKSVRKYIRKEKARIRRVSQNPVEAEQKILELTARTRVKKFGI